MEIIAHKGPEARSWPGWLAAGLAGFAAPALALLLLSRAPAASPFAVVAAPILAVGLMGAGMIAAAAGRRWWIGLAIALATGAVLIALAGALGMPAFPHLISTGFALVIASASFAARGALFARSAAEKGWWIAVAVVAGEAAMLATAAAMPGSLPDWLLALLPAQWASTAIRTGLAGTGALAASSEMLALAATATTTMIVARLWPRRWPYLLMFGAWLGCSALVLHRPAPGPAPATPNADQLVAASASLP